MIYVNKFIIYIFIEAMIEVNNWDCIAAFIPLDI